MKKIYLLAAGLLTCLSFAQVSFTAVGTAVTQNFDGMGTTLPTGWSAYRDSGSGTLGQDLAPVVDNGSSNSGAMYSVGETNATDRALGSIASGSTVPAFGAQFTNNTGSTITSINVNFTEEQWRTGSNATADEIVAFTFSTNATGLNDAAATWTPLTAGNLTEILTTATDNAAVNGNLPANQLNKTFTITGLSLANGSSIWIKWTDANDFGSDCLLAIDNLSLTPLSGTLAVSDISKTKLNFIKNSFVKNNEISFGADVKDVKVYTLTGQLVKSSSVKANETLNVAELQKGNYIVTGTINNQAVSQKILKD